MVITVQVLFLGEGGASGSSRKRKIRKSKRRRRSRFDVGSSEHPSLKLNIVFWSRDFLMNIRVVLNVKEALLRSLVYMAS